MWLIKTTSLKFAAIILDDICQAPVIGAFSSKLPVGKNNINLTEWFKININNLLI